MRPAACLRSATAASLRIPSRFSFPALLQSRSECAFSSACGVVGTGDRAAEVPVQEVEQLGERLERLARAGVEMLDAAAHGLIGRPASAANLNEKAVFGSHAP